MPTLSPRTALASAIAASCLAAPAFATTLEITVTNDAPANGLAVTPVFSAFHDGTFDPFNVGEANTSAGLETLAEEGPVDGLQSEFTAAQPDGASIGVGQAGNGAPPVEPGEVGSETLTVDGVNGRYFSYFSMVVPSNDTFVANDDPFAFEVFDEAGNFLGPQTITILGSAIWDLGTEVNDASDGPAFLQGVDMSLGTAENGVVTAGQSLNAFGGLTTASGYVVDGDVIDFTENRDGFPVATITIDETIAPIPVPAALPLLGGALGMLGFGAWRRRS